MSIPLTYWFTGLPGAGKSTLTAPLADLLHRDGQACVVLDGDEIRAGLSRDLGFSAEDRHENIRRVAEIARLVNNNGQVAICALIAPFASDREAARRVIGGERFIEVFIDAPLEVCESRDPKGMYRKAHSGTLASFTGVSAPYEVPIAPDIRLQTDQLSVSECAKRLADLWRRRIR